MICISHLLPDEEMKEFTQKYGTGIESIDFSISDNLDRLFSSLDAYKEKKKVMGADSLLLHGPFPGVKICMEALRKLGFI